MKKTITLLSALLINGSIIANQLDSGITKATPICIKWKVISNKKITIGPGESPGHLHQPIYINSSNYLSETTDINICTLLENKREISYIALHHQSPTDFNPNKLYMRFKIEGDTVETAKLIPFPPLPDSCANPLNPFYESCQEIKKHGQCVLASNINNSPIFNCTF